ncbi:hypothetical protein HDU76_013784 [Blyttiomyces sp. JEL0837]|nr:hypothetical protein HDU76_013784 [Blyttiomyces sp. JEL0837]
MSENARLLSPPPQPITDAINTHNASTPDSNTQDYINITEDEEEEVQPENNIIKPKSISLGQYILVCLGLVFAEAIHGGYAVVAKILFQGGEKMHPVTFILLRSLIAFPLLLIMARLIENPSIGVLPKTLSQWVLCLQLGVLAVSGNQLFHAGGVIFTTPFNVSMWQQLIPIITTILSVFLGRENLNPKTFYGLSKILCIITAVSGAYIIVARPKSIPESIIITAASTSATWLLGNLFLFTNCLFFSIYLLFAQNLLTKYQPITLTAWSYTGGFILNLVVFVMTATYLSIAQQQNPQNPPLLSFPIPSGIYGILYAGVLSSAVAYAVLTWATKETSPPVVTIFVPLQSLVSGVVSWIVLNEEFGVLDWVGGLVVCVGVFGLVYVRWVEGLHGVQGGRGKAGGRDEDEDEGDGEGENAVLIEDVDDDNMGRRPVS